MPLNLNLLKKVFLFVIIPVIQYFYGERNFEFVLQLYTAEILLFYVFTVITSLRHPDGQGGLFGLIFDFGFIYFICFLSVLGIVFTAPIDIYENKMGLEKIMKFLIDSSKFLLLLIPTELIYLYIQNKFPEFKNIYNVKNFGILIYKYSALFLLALFAGGIFIAVTKTYFLALVFIVLGRLILEFTLEKLNPKKYDFDQTFL